MVGRGPFLYVLLATCGRAGFEITSGIFASRDIPATSMSRATSRGNGRPPLVRVGIREGADSWPPCCVRRRPLEMRDFSATSLSRAQSRGNGRPPMVASENVDTKQLERIEHQSTNQAHQIKKANKRGLYAPIGLPFPSSAKSPLSFAQPPGPFNQ
jgi:hypothetical protein